MSESAHCSNCEATLQIGGKFCSLCGQKAITAKDRTFGALMGASFEEATSLNGRLLPTIGLLLARPGALSRAYRLGQWRRYLTPINVFLLANLVFFLAPSLTDFNVSLRDQQTLQPYSAWVAPWIDAHVAASGMAFDDYADLYQQRSSDVAKTMVIVHTPMLALVTLLLFWDRRFLYADHVVTAMHFFAFLMLYFAALPFILWPVLVSINAVLGTRLNTLLIPIALLLVYVPVMLRTAFDIGWVRALLSALIFVPMLQAANLVYRLLQLAIVMTLI